MRKVMLVVFALGCCLPWACDPKKESPATPVGPSGPVYTFPFLLAFGSPGTGPGQFNGCEGIAVDPNREVIFVADYINNRVQKFDLNGNYQLQWTCSAGCGGAFYHPVDLALDPAGYLYISDGGNNRIVKLDPNGNLMAVYGGPGTIAGQFDFPNGLWVDENYFLWVADYGNNRVQHRAPNGSWSVHPGLTSPTDVVSDWGSSSFYVTLISASQIRQVKFDNSSSVTIANPGSGDGQLDFPLGLHKDRDGNLWVADMGNDRIQKLTPSGGFLAKFGQPGTNPGRFNQSKWLALDNHQNVYVSDISNSYINKFAPY